MDFGCPIATQTAGVQGSSEIRAYKLGKKRWSYNSVELVLTDEAGEGAGGAGADAPRRRAVVQQAVHCTTKFPEAHQDSAVGFLLQLESGVKLQAHVYLCYDSLPADSASTPGAGATAGASSGRGCGPSLVPGTQHYAWQLVTRQHCCKGCEGRVLRSIQRFGRVGKRAGSAGEARAAAAAADGGAGAALALVPAAGMKKDPKFMYLSLDEACTHVDAPAFRLVAGIYNRQGTKLLATSVSPAIRVLANNDVPTGAARITLEAHLPSDWEGWAAEEAGPAPIQPVPLQQLAPPRAPKPAPSPVTRRKPSAKPCQAARASSPDSAGPSAGSCPQDSSDLNMCHPLNTPDVKEALGRPTSAVGRAVVSSQRQRERRQQQQAQQAQQQRQQRFEENVEEAGPLGQGPKQDQQGQRGQQGSVSPWELPAVAHASPTRRDGTQLLPRTLSLPASAFHFLQQQQQQQQQQQGKGADGDSSVGGTQRRLRRRLSQPAGSADFEYDNCLEGGTGEANPSGAPASCTQQAHWLASAGPDDSRMCAPGGGGGSDGGGSADLAGQCEAERQLRLLNQLKAQLLAAKNEASSSGSDPHSLPHALHALPGYAPLASQLSTEQLPMHLLPLPSPAGAHQHPRGLYLGSCCPSASHLAGSESLLAGSHRSSSLLAEESGMMLDNLGLSLLGAEDESSDLHMALMDAAPGVEMLDIRSLFEDEEPMIRA